MKTLSLEDDGYIKLLVTKPGEPIAPPVAVELDVFDTFNSLRVVLAAELDQAEAEKRPALAAERCRDWLNKTHNLGCSAAFADKLYGALKEEVARLEKKDPSNKPAEIPKPSDSPSGRTAPSDSPPA